MSQMAETRSPTTADELLRLPHGEHRFELVRGEARAMGPAGWHHGVDPDNTGSAVDCLGAWRA